MDVAKLQAENRALEARLQQLEEEKHATVDQLSESLKSKERENRLLRAQIKALNARLYGPRSEKIDPGQLLLEFMEQEAEIPPHAHEAPDDEEERPKGKK